MRFKVIDRLVSAFSGLVILMMGIGVFVFGIGVLPFRLDLSFLDKPLEVWQRALIVAGSLALCFAGLRGIALLFRSSKEKGFILQHTEYGDLSISMSAMENMVKKCVDTHDELKVSGTRIRHARDGVIINMRIALAGGVNIPIAVNALQKQIKQYITSCSGVDVKEVRVMVETNNSLAAYTGAKIPDTLKADADAAAKAGEVVDSLHEAVQNAMPAENAPEATPDKEPFHKRLFKREEKQQFIPQPPATEPEETAQTVACMPEPDITPASPEITDTSEPLETTLDSDQNDKEEER